MTVSLIVGAGGFVGRHLDRHLRAQGDCVRYVSRRQDLECWRGLQVLGTSEATLTEALAGIDRIFFTAGIAHEAVADGRGELHRLNVVAPVHWLRAANRAGVSGFVWLSSIKVLGDVSPRPLLVDDPYRPGDAYAHSKVEAERQLLATPATATAVSIVRPPLVHGPGVRGNFRRLLNWADGPWPLPVKHAGALRSLVSADNLCALLARLTPEHSGVFHVADPQDVTVSTLLQDLRRLLGRPPRQFALPAGVLRTAARLTGRSGLYARLFESLRVDQSATRDRLGWVPQGTTSQSLQDTVTWFQTLH
jgi:UDP-glucose 4-epimerase